MGIHQVQDHCLVDNRRKQLPPEDPKHKYNNIEVNLAEKRLKIKLKILMMLSLIEIRLKMTKIALRKISASK